MGLETALLLGGTALSAGAGAWGAGQQAGAARDAASQQAAHRQMLMQLIQPRLGKLQTGDIQAQIEGLLKGSQQGGTPITGAAIDLSQLPSIPGVDISGNQAFNTGQDALLQYLRSNPATQRSAAEDAMTGMLATGQPFNTTDYFSAMQPAETRALDEAVARIGGSAGSLGQRFGTATQRQTNDAVGALTEQANLRRQELGRTSYEAAQGRRLQSAGLLSEMERARVQNMLGAVGATQAGANLDLSAQRANADTRLNEAQLLASVLGQNAQLGQSAQQFNANLGLQNTSQQAALIQALLGARTAGTQADMGYLSLLAGLPTPGMNPAAGAVPGAIAEAGGALAMLPFMLQLLGKKG